MRIAYIVLTCEKYEKTRKVWQMDTVFCSVPKEDIYYLGHTMRPEDRLFSWGAMDDYDSLPHKFVDFFVHSDSGSGSGSGSSGSSSRGSLDYDWYFLMDDDTYLYVDRLKEKISTLEINPQNDPYMEGCILTHLAGTPWGLYHSGGAGTLLSAKVYDEIKKQLRAMIVCGEEKEGTEEMNKKIYTPPHICADISLGLWASGLPGIQREHCEEYHTEMSEIAGRDVPREVEKKALTFHHLKTKEDFWAHWLLGQKREK
jgi:hypothetical protein